MIVVLGASGHTGAAIVERLRRAGEPVRAVGRSLSRLGRARASGAEAAVGDIADVAFLTDAFRGARAVYALVPTDRTAADYVDRHGREGAAIVRALRAARVPRVVALSSLGAHLSEGTGLILELRAQERRLVELDEADVLLLRPASFFENFLDALDTIRAHGLVVDSVHPDIPQPMVATADVAAVATAGLRDGGWRGVEVRELLGPADLSWREATRLIGQAIGQPDLPYVQLPPDELVGAMVASGLSREFATLYVQMTDAFNRRLVQPTGDTTARATTTPTPFAAFVAELATAYRGA